MSNNNKRNFSIEEKQGNIKGNYLNPTKNQLNYNEAVKNKHEQVWELKQIENIINPFFKYEYKDMSRAYNDTSFKPTIKLHQSNDEVRRYINLNHIKKDDNFIIYVDKPDEYSKKLTNVEYNLEELKKLKAAVEQQKSSYHNTRIDNADGLIKINSKFKGDIELMRLDRLNKKKYESQIIYSSLNRSMNSKNKYNNEILVKENDLDNEKKTNDAMMNLKKSKEFEDFINNLNKSGQRSKSNSKVNLNMRYKNDYIKQNMVIARKENKSDLNNKVKKESENEIQHKNDFIKQNKTITRKEVKSMSKPEIKKVKVDKDYNDIHKISIVKTNQRIDTIPKIDSKVKDVSLSDPKENEKEEVKEEEKEIEKEIEIEIEIEEDVNKTDLKNQSIKMDTADIEKNSYLNEEKEIDKYKEIN